MASALIRHNQHNTNYRNTFCKTGNNSFFFSLNKHKLTFILSSLHPLYLFSTFSLPILYPITTESVDRKYRRTIGKLSIVPSDITATTARSSLATAFSIVPPPFQHPLRNIFCQMENNLYLCTRKNKRLCKPRKQDYKKSLKEQNNTLFLCSNVRIVGQQKSGLYYGKTLKSCWRWITLEYISWGLLSTCLQHLFPMVLQNIY